MPDKLVAILFYESQDAQSWTVLFRAFSFHRQPSASLTKSFPSWTRLRGITLLEKLRAADES